MKFSESNVRRLKAPEGKSDITIWDNGMPGFGIRFRDGGAGVYIIQYKVDGKDAKLTLGKVANRSNRGEKAFRVDRTAD